MVNILIKKPNTIRGKSISEFSRNLVSMGWPSEFRNSEERDKIAYTERKLGRPLRRNDYSKIK